MPRPQDWSMLDVFKVGMPCRAQGAAERGDIDEVREKGQRIGLDHTGAYRRLKELYLVF